MRPFIVVALSFVVLGCTDAGLVDVGAGGPAGPDRADFKGTACVPLAAGSAFPVKVLFALEGGAGVDRQVVGNIVDGLNAVSTQFSTDYISFAVVGFHTVATGFQGSFVRDERVVQAFARYGAYNESGPISMRAPLRLARSLISGDMQTGCRGLVARTRYYIVLVVTQPDTSCANPVFNAGIDTRCNAFLGDPDICLDCETTGDPASCDLCQRNRRQCSECELARVTEELRETGRRYNAGEVTVQPIYVRTTQDPQVSAMVAAIARAGGTEVIETTPDAVGNVLTSLNYASLQRQLKLKRLVAMNRNTLSRQSQVLVDSDGDGLSDEQELVIGTDPTAPDSDGDRLGDGVEVRMGLRPQADPANLNIISGCNTELDDDGDRLNNCEERVLGTDSCIADTDGDGLPDLVEFLGGTNPLIAEDLADDERDGLSNVGEIEKHTDPISADIAFQNERGYGYAIQEGAPTVDGRACYDLDIFNVTVRETLERPSPDGSGLVIPRGTNDIYIYLQVGRENDPRGTGIGSLFVPSVRFLDPNNRRPRGTVNFTPDDFVAGN